jgi:hypothetical protein
MRKILIVAAVVLVVIVGLVFLRRNEEPANMRSRIAALERENAELRAQLARSPAAPPVSSREASPAPRVAPAPERPAAPLPAGSDDEARLRRLRDELGVVSEKAAQFEAKVRELEAQLGELQSEHKRVAASEREINDDLSRANRLVNVLQAELKTKSERLVQVEIANNKLKELNGADAQRLRQITGVAQELQEIHRRREVYLVNILRRYKEVTDQYRSVSTAESPLANSADLARIQNTIALAEDDLRQLNSLNAQALRLQNKLGVR